MPKANKSSMHEQCTVESVHNHETSHEESTSSEQEKILTPNNLHIEEHKRCQVICLI